MAKICLSLTKKTLALDMEILEKYRDYVDIAELRVDCLDPDERLLIRRFPEMAGIPVILSIRRSVDGGYFISGEGARISLLAKGLAYAEADRRLNFAYVDLEEDLHVPGLEEAARAFGTRIIRSWYNKEVVYDDFAEKIKNLRRIGDELVKISMTPVSLEDLINIYRIKEETRGIEKIFHVKGEYGLSTGLLSDFFGSNIYYSSDETGQVDPKELTKLYRFHDINKDTKIFAAAGNSIISTASVRFFNTVFGIEKTNAIFIHIPVDSLNSLLRLADETGISGISLDAPFKEEILHYLPQKSKEVLAIGACNVITATPQGWTGYNTDAPAFSDSLLGFLGKKDLRRRKLTIAGSGNIARAVAAEVYRLKGKALVLSRAAAQARLLAEPYRFNWADSESRGMDFVRKYAGIIIQAGSLGMESEDDHDPLEYYKFSGDEVIMGLTGESYSNRCLKRAEEAGCRILNGHEMLHRQVRYKYNYFMNKEFPPSLVSRVGFLESNDGSGKN